LGLFAYIHEFSKKDSESAHLMFHSNQLAMFFNCKKESVENVLEKPILRDTSEVSVS